MSQELTAISALTDEVIKTYSVTPYDDFCAANAVTDKTKIFPAGCICFSNLKFSPDSAGRD